VWNVVRRDAATLWVRETMDQLLPDGDNLVELSVSDAAGNVAVDTIRFALPSAAYLRTLTPTLDLSNNATDEWADGLAIDSAGTVGFMTVSRSLFVFDPESLRAVATVDAFGPTQLQSVVYDDRAREAYVGGFGILRFDPVSNTFLGKFTGTLGTIGMVQSRSDPDLLYSGDAFSGWLVYNNTSTHALVDIMEIPYVGDEFAFDMAVLPGDAKLYMTRYDQGGILVIDPATKTVLRHITTASLHPFYADEFALSPDDRHLYVALRDAAPRGVGDLDTQLDSVVRVLSLGSAVPRGIGLSPSGRRLFVTVSDGTLAAAAPNVLIDVPQWRVIQTFARHAPGANDRADGPVKFRPDGKVFFATHDQAVDVYLSRESRP